MLSEKLLIPYAFQPIINLRTGRVFGHEALMRPDSMTPQGYILSTIGPDGRVDTHKIELQTFYSALHYSIGLNGRIFVNSFPNEVLSDEELDEMKEIFGKEAFSRLVIEMLEYPRFEKKKWQKKREQIQKNGSLLAVDDYGTGLSDIDMVHILNPDIVKIDSSYLRAIGGQKSTYRELESMIEELVNEGVDVLVEGIETERDLNRVRMTPATYGQGYFIAMPKIRTDGDVRESLKNKFKAVV